MPNPTPCPNLLAAFFSSHTTVPSSLCAAADAGSQPKRHRRWNTLLRFALSHRCLLLHTSDADSTALVPATTCPSHLRDCLLLFFKRRPPEFFHQVLEGEISLFNTLAIKGTMIEPLMKDRDKCVDPELWHACAGGIVQIPTVNSKVYYFPQGHAEHAQEVVNLGTSQRIPPLIPCRVVAIKFMADHETDEVFARIKMNPLSDSELDYIEDDGLDLRMNGFGSQENPASFAKTLTQSDANNGGGFSVPRYCAETIFPRLDYSADPPVQTVIAKDVHGDAWKFRHIYRGTPRRHLLTTGWSNFVNQKKLVAGDSIVFLRAQNGDLCVGIRRARVGKVGDGPETRVGWNSLGGNGGSNCGGFAVFLRDEESKLLRNDRGNSDSCTGKRGRSKVLPDSVFEAANLAANGQPFAIMYYPRASTPEFCVRAGAVKAAMRIHWCPGMRFKMAFETEDLSRISWFMGSISSIQVADPVRWPNSPWKLLQVTWDEPNLRENVRQVNPWLVELVSNTPAVHLTDLLPPTKKSRIPQHLNFPFDSQFKSSMILGNPLFPPSIAPAAIQGARHTQFDLSLSDFHLDKIPTDLLYPAFCRVGYATPPSRISAGVIVASPPVNDNVSCLLTIAHPPQSLEKPSDTKPTQLMLFGQPILTEQEVFLSKPENTIGRDATRNSPSDRNIEKSSNKSNGLKFAPTQKRSLKAFPCHLEHQSLELDIETGHCKVFMESEDVGHTLDLSVFGSYEELYGRLADMFGINCSNMTSQILYQDATGAMKHTGDEPFSEFMKTARRLTISIDSGSDNFAR
ncbi:hypothetical protein ZIOFF_030241 [Zingiber officinale]|uniref:Auxin response factor n=2 Tax=Zingiber officinale TaxID=94328 RepID=A0A8J5GXY8_ZINOF|nr:hypothetical protein ZIOFF_030241 [Zingiber officinale]